MQPRSMMRAAAGIAWGVLLALAALSTPAAAERVRYAYDALDRLVRVDYPDGTRILYTYDPGGNVRSVTVTQEPEKGGEGAAGTTPYGPPAPVQAPSEPPVVGPPPPPGR